MILKKSGILQGFLFVCLLGCVTCSSVERRFVVNGNNVVFNNQNIHNGQTVYITHVDTVAQSKGCNLYGRHLRIADVVQDPNNGCSIWYCTASGMAVNSNRCPNVHLPPSAYYKCNYQGVTYEQGVAFLHQDGCNHCVCSKTIECSSFPTCSGTGGCLSNGVRYSNGQGFKHTDGCNVCMCNTGRIQCTTHTCGTTQPPSTTNRTPPHPARPTCAYNGQVYFVGDVVPTYPDCTECMCTTRGFHCTWKQCNGGLPFSTAPPLAVVQPNTCTYQGQTYTHGQIFPDIDGCNKCMCAHIGRACTQNTCNTATMTTQPVTAPTAAECFDANSDPNYCMQRKNMCIGIGTVARECKKTCGYCK